MMFQSRMALKWDSTSDVWLNLNTVATARRSSFLLIAHRPGWLGATAYIGGMTLGPPVKTSTHARPIRTQHQTTIVFNVLVDFGHAGTLLLSKLGRAPVRARRRRMGACAGANVVPNPPLADIPRPLPHLAMGLQTSPEHIRVAYT